MQCARELLVQLGLSRRWRFTQAFSSQLMSGTKPDLGRFAHRPLLAVIPTLQRIRLFHFAAPLSLSLSLSFSLSLSLSQDDLLQLL